MQPPRNRLFTCMTRTRYLYAQVEPHSRIHRPIECLEGWVDALPRPNCTPHSRLIACTHAPQIMLYAQSPQPTYPSLVQMVLRHSSRRTLSRPDSVTLKRVRRDNIFDTNARAHRPVCRPFNWLLEMWGRFGTVNKVVPKDRRLQPNACFLTDSIQSIAD